MKILAAAGIVAPLLFTAVVLVHGAMHPDYDGVRLPVGTLSAWPDGWIQSLNHLVASALIGAYTLGLRRGVQPGPARAIAFAWLAVSVLGLFLLALFPWSYEGDAFVEPGGHVIGSIMMFAGAGIGHVALARALVADPRWRDRSRCALVTGIAILVLFGVSAGFAVPPGTPLEPWTGALQRVTLLAWFACTIVLAWRLESLARRPR